VVGLFFEEAGVDDEDLAAAEGDGVGGEEEEGGEERKGHGGGRICRPVYSGAGGAPERGAGY